MRERSDDMRDSDRPAQRPTLKLYNVRLSFEHIWKKSASIKNGPEKFRASFLLDPKTKDGKHNIALIQDEIDSLIDEHWDGRAPKFKDDRYPLLNGDDVLDRNGDVRDGYADMRFIKAGNDHRPKVKDRNGRDDLTEEDGKIYSGAYVTAYLRLYPVKSADKGGNGIFASLEGVQFLDHGDRFGGGGMDDDEFEDYGEGDDDRRSQRERDDRGGRPGRTIDDDPPPRDRDDDRGSRRRTIDDDPPPRDRDRRSSHPRDDDRDRDDDRGSRRRTIDDDPPPRGRDREDDRDRPRNRGGRDRREANEDVRSARRREDDDRGRRRSAADEI